MAKRTLDIAFSAIGFFLVGTGILLILWRAPIAEEHWHILGEISRNTNALAVLAASIAAYIAWGTNRSRAIEAKRSDFKDRIHWAAQNFTAEPTLTSIAAGKIIDQFTQDSELSKNDTETARALADQKEEIISIRDEKARYLIAEAQKKLPQIDQLLDACGPISALPFMDEDGKRKTRAKLSQSRVQLMTTAIVTQNPSIPHLTEHLEALDKMIELLEDISNRRRENEYAQHATNHG